METTLPLPLDAEVYKGNCPTREILSRVADKWTVLLINILAGSEKLRFNELRRMVGGISQKMLTQTLRDLERDGLVERRLYPEVPPRAEYSLTSLGRTLCAPIGALAEWAHAHIDEVRRAQAAFDARRR